MKDSAGEAHGRAFTFRRTVLCSSSVRFRLIIPSPILACGEISPSRFTDQGDASTTESSSVKIGQVVSCSLPIGERERVLWCDGLSYRFILRTRETLFFSYYSILKRPRCTSQYRSRLPPIRPSVSTTQPGSVTPWLLSSSSCTFLLKVSCRSDVFLRWSLRAPCCCVFRACEADRRAYCCSRCVRCLQRAFPSMLHTVCILCRTKAD